MTETLGPSTPTACYYVDHASGDVMAYGMYSTDQPEPAARPGLVRLSISLIEYSMLQSAPQDCWVDDGAIAERTAAPLTLSSTSIDADGEDELTISAIPTGTSIRVFGSVVLPWTLVTSSSVILTSSVPGKMRIEARCPPPYLNWSATVDAI